MQEQTSNSARADHWHMFMMMGGARLLLPFIPLIIAAGLVVLLAFSQSLGTIPRNPIPSSSPATIGMAGCASTLWQHVYDSGRLTRVKDCVIVSGTVEPVPDALTDPDGDGKFLLRPDPQYRSMLNGLNQSLYGGDLVIKVVCATYTQQPNALAACANYHNSIDLPQRGAHVQVTGSYVFDPVLFGAFGWMEIHPVSKIEAVQ